MKSCEKSVIVVGNKQEPKPCTQSRNKDKSSIKQRLIGQTWKSDVYKLNKYALLVMSWHDFSVDKINNLLYFPILNY